MLWACITDDLSGTSLISPVRSPEQRKETHITHHNNSKMTWASQDKPYALFGTCLGAIVVYEVARRTTAAGNPPVALFTAAVSPPHIYAEAVMKLYVTRQMAEGEAIDVEEVMNTLRSWDKIPRETLMMVPVQSLLCLIT